ncbi:MAG: hypothetical protein JXQ66_02860 [Campylobacterales bacterium]|nr:hypothetical protein [Campylobacterales bacterium]
MTKQTLNPNFSHFNEFLQNIKTHFASNPDTIHKARNELKIISFNDTATVVKSFKIPNIINQVVYSFFRDSKAKKSYEYSLKIGDFTPKPIGYIEFYSSYLLKESYFVSEKFEYDFTIREPLLDDNFDDKDGILRAFARFSLKLHDAGIFHKDYSPGNILIKKDASGYIFKVVDINRMGFFELSIDDRAKNFSKLWARDDELEIIADEYAKHFDAPSDFAKKICYYSNKNKDIKNFKKRLKGKKIDG